MTKKETIPYAALLAKVQAVLASHPECRNVQVNGLELYREQVDGANWAIAVFRCSGDDHDLPACQQKILSEIVSLRETYDSEDRK